MMNDVVKWGRIFHILCIVFAAISMLTGIILLIYSYQVSAQLGSSLTGIDSAISASSAILSNVTELTSSAASSSQTLSQNVSVMLGNLSSSIGTIQYELQQEADSFNSANYPLQNSQQIGAALESLAAQFGVINSHIPPLHRLVNGTASRISTPLSNIAQETSRLNNTLSSLAGTYRSDVDSIQATVPVLFVGFGVYAILQGVIFLVLGRISSYLLAGTLVPKEKEKKKQNTAVKKNAEAPREAEDEEKEDKEDEGKKGNLGIIGSIKDALGIE
jgi:hypothetical protein